MKSLIQQVLPEISNSEFAINADTMEVTLLSNDEKSSAQQIIKIFNQIDDKIDKDEEEEGG